MVMHGRQLCRRGSVAASFGPLSFLSGGYGEDAERLGRIAAELCAMDRREAEKKAMAQVIASDTLTAKGAED
jgi:hypothetical protein